MMLSLESSLKSKFGNLWLLYLFLGIVSYSKAQQYQVNLSVNDIFNNENRQNRQFKDSILKIANQKVIHYNLSAGIAFCTKLNSVFKMQYSQSASNSRLLMENSKDNNLSTFLDSFNIKNIGLQFSYGKRKTIDKLYFFYGTYLGYNREIFNSITQTKIFRSNQLQQVITRTDKEPTLNIYKLGVYAECYYNFTRNISLGVTFNSWLGYFIAKGKLETYYTVKSGQGNLVDSNSNLIDTKTTSIHAEPVNFSLSILCAIMRNTPKPAPYEP